MANAFSRAFIKPAKKRIKPFLLAHEVAFDLTRNNFSNYFTVMKKLYHLYVEHGFMPDEALRLGLLNKEENSGKSFVSKKAMLVRQYRINPASFMPLTEDKAIFSIFCAKNNIPIAKLYGLFFSDSIGLNLLDNENLKDKEDWGDFFNNKCPNEFVVKPSNGVYGNEIIFVTEENFSGADIYNKLKASQYESFVVQELLKNHPSLMLINPKDGLQTIRVITLVDNDLEVEIVYAFFKIIVGDNKIDNHKSGAFGNLLCGIDLSDGTLKVPLLMTDHGLIEVPEHPDTGKKLTGLTLPFWKEAVKLAKETAPHFLPMKTIGWDIALTPAGPRIVEGNARWDPPKCGNFGEEQLSIFDEIGSF